MGNVNILDVLFSLKMTKGTCQCLIFKFSILLFKEVENVGREFIIFIENIFSFAPLNLSKLDKESEFI